MLALPEWLHDISVKANRGRARKIKDGLSGSTLWTPAEPVYRKLVNKRQREILTSEAAALLKRGKLSPFEHEAAVRTGLRLRFIGEGHGWAHSDLEADAIVQAAFASMGVERPTWYEGQPSAAIGPDFCQCCYSPLDDADLATHRRFCSDACAKVMKNQDYQRWHVINQSVRSNAFYIAKLDEIPERLCSVCGNGFRSLKTETDTCSPECTGIAKRTVPVKNCKHCGTRFRPHTVTAGGVYCSKSCKDQSRRLKPKACRTCDVQFQPKTRRDVYCSSVCKPGLAEIACEQCGDLFAPATKRAQFCSRACKDSAKNRLRALEAEAARAATIKPKSCVICEGMFTPRRPRDLSCGAACQKEHQRHEDAKRYAAKKAARSAFRCDPA